MDAVKSVFQGYFLEVACADQRYILAAKEYYGYEATLFRGNGGYVISGGTSKVCVVTDSRLLDKMI